MRLAVPLAELLRQEDRDVSANEVSLLSLCQSFYSRKNLVLCPGKELWVAVESAASGNCKKF